MAKFSLIPFDPATAPKIRIETELNQNSDSLFISYRIRAGFDLIDCGSGTPKKERITGLWEKTCFELFVKNESGQYVEFNFSPNFEWNCFYFNKKGDALSEWSKMRAPATDILFSEDHFLHFSVIKKDLFPDGFFDSEHSLSVGITAVIKEKTGALSYWALSHADSRPNFHHFDSFKYKF
ncbi:MAG: hypothetical protein WC635_15275 [Bacteriovorax sp.]|jgi:hypothetical protein